MIPSTCRRTRRNGVALLTVASALVAPSISRAAPTKTAPTQAAPTKAAPVNPFNIPPGLDLEITPKYPQAGERGPDVPEFVVRPGYRVTLVARDLGEARFLEIDDKGTLYVSQPGRGEIATLRLKNGVYEKLGTFISNKKSVHGMCFHKGWMWFTQSGAIYKARDTNGDGAADETITVIAQGQLPEGGGHWWRSIAVNDNFFFTSIGDSGNISDHTGDDREKVWRYNLDGSGKTLWSSGIRNTEKLRFRPGTPEVWGADHGSDNFGAPLEKEGQKGQAQPITDLNPPCEFNFYEEGKFYGHPFVTGNRVPRIEFQNRPDILELAAKTTPPAWSFGGHWAPNGWTFLSKSYFPDHRGDAFVALHGSWNSSLRVGYRIERVMFDPMTGKPFGSQMIVGMMTPKGEVLDRPVDCVEAPDGSVLFSCDSRRIFRISRVAATKTPSATKTANKAVAQTAGAKIVSPLKTGKKKMVALSGDAALLYIYQRHRNKQTLGPNGRFYLSANGRVYYRDAQRLAHWVTAPRQPILIPADQAQQFSSYRGYNGNLSIGRNLRDLSNTETRFAPVPGS